MSLTSKLSLSITKCISFTKDKLFQNARGVLQDSGNFALISSRRISLNEFIIKGKLKQWTDLCNVSERSIDEITTQPTMDSVMFLPDRFEVNKINVIRRCKLTHRFIL